MFRIRGPVPCLSRCGVALSLGQGGFSLPQPHSPPSNSGLITERDRGDKKCPLLSFPHALPSSLLSKKDSRTPPQADRLPHRHGTGFENDLSSQAQMENKGRSGCQSL
jgi:hypothetical protein